MTGAVGRALICCQYAIWVRIDRRWRLIPSRAAYGIGLAVVDWSGALASTKFSLQSLCEKSGPVHTAPWRGGAAGRF
jgi:hypothetical protein